MKFRFKGLNLHVLILCLFLVGLIALPACGGSSDNGKTVIRVAYQQFGPPPYYEQEWWTRVKQQVEAANPKIELQLQPIIADEGSYYTKLALQLRSNNPPDIVREDSFLISSDVTAGYLAPLDDYINSWPDYKQQWFPSMQKITTFNNKNYGIMDGTDVRGIWYNKDIFQKAGLPTDWQPKTWADILTAARTIKSKVPGVVPMNLYSGIPMDEASTMQGFEMLLYGTKDPLYNYDTNKWIASSKGFQDALDFVKQVYSSSSLLGPTNDIALNTQAGNTVAQQLIPQGKLAIDIDGSWIPGSWQKGGAAEWPAWQKTMGVAKMPTQNGEDPQYVTLSGGWAYSISANSKHKSDAFNIIKTAFSKDNLAFYDVKASQITPRKDVADVADYKNLPLSDFFTGLVAVTQFRPGFPAYPKISVEIDRAMQNVMQGQSSSDAMNAFYNAVKSIAGDDKVEKRT